MISTVFFTGRELEGLQLDECALYGSTWFRGALLPLHPAVFCSHSTVTDFARFLGWSISQSRFFGDVVGERAGLQRVEEKRERAHQL